MSAADGVVEAPTAPPRHGWRGGRSERQLLGWHRALLGLALPVGAALAWEVAVRAGLAQGRLLPAPSFLLATLADLARSGDLDLHIRATLARVAAGFALGVAAGTLFGALAGASGLARALIDPTLQGLRAIPSIAWVPLFILWLGIFEASKVTLIAVGVAFPVYLGTLGAILSVDRKIIEVGRSFRLTRLQLARRILLPAVLPHYIVALRSGLGLGWMFVVAAEFMGASEGLGYLLVDGQQLGKPAQIVAAIVVFAVLGKLTDALLVAASSPLLRWEDTAQRAVAAEG
ncbi:binding-protein-dependent transport systems inner membrane component [Ancylobacter novellus DSM 506]|uniref:Binding-protein-dependent transport systems inner membrane component n=1 Tax=Ancylobacter novellus (strain ATCC 8093 / DSM 506 / JCM 20403 / CCM 1077 / IAM 12100 / NBRC 12443 / NCIMB 10456) TaxID=639283 RepID=D7A634_ANCN5|nr:ABC transporter permease [Ancylobacter novellus]ADH88184.1 binding-protein-dependent transport systems inner membrane component [Ancylobacter novellus DSM 506]